MHASSTKLSITWYLLQNWLLRAEKELWPLLQGPWAQHGLEYISHRRAWVAAVRGASSLADPDACVRQLRECLILLEACVRRQMHVLRSHWEPHARPGRGKKTCTAARAHT